MRTYSKPRHIWRALYPPLIYLALSFVVSFAAIFGYGLYLGFREAARGITTIAPDILMEQTTAFTLENALWIQLIACLLSLVVFIPLWRIDRRTHTRNQGGSLSAATIALIAGIGIGLNVVIVCIFEITDLVRYFPSYDLINDAIVSGNLPIQILTVCLFGPVAEELCFRGLAQNRLSSWLPVWAAVLISSVLFGVIHLNLLQGLYAFLLGITMSLIYIRVHSLWAPILCHVAFNSASIALNAVLENTGVDVSAWLLFIPAALLTAVCTWLLYKKTTSHNALET